MVLFWIILETLNALIYNIEHSGKSIWKKGVFLWGAKFQHEEIQDELLEWKNQDSAGYSVPFIHSNELKFSEYLLSENSISSNRLTGYIQNNWNLLQKKGKSQLNLNTGLRANYWDYNNQTVISPRAFSFTHHLPLKEIPQEKNIKIHPTSVIG